MTTFNEPATLTVTNELTENIRISWDGERYMLELRREQEYRVIILNPREMQAISDFSIKHQPSGEATEMVDHDYQWNSRTGGYVEI